MFLIIKNAPKEKPSFRRLYQKTALSTTYRKQCEENHVKQAQRVFQVLTSSYLKTATPDHDPPVMQIGSSHQSLRVVCSVVDQPTYPQHYRSILEQSFLAKLSEHRNLTQKEMVAQDHCRSQGS